MFRPCVRSERWFIARRCAPGLLLLGFLVSAPLSRAQVALGPVTLGAGLRTSYAHSDGDVGSSTDQFMVNDARLYINGPVTDHIKFMFNTDYDSATDHMAVLDAVARFEFSRKFNVWAGRFLEPSDRANLYGPFYAHNWEVYQDGVQNGQPSVYQGRDNGVAYWGDFGKKTKVKVSGGVFDGSSADKNPDVIAAARVQIDFWDAEDGYYLNGTYYGDKNLLAIGGSTQVQSGKTANTFDFLLERKLPNGGAFSDRSRICRLQRSGRVLAGLRQEPGRLWTGKLHLSESRRNRQVRNPGQVRQDRVAGSKAERHAEDH